MVKSNRFNSEEKNMTFDKVDPHQFKKMPNNSIACYRMEEGLNIQSLCRILGVSNRSAKELCESSHPSAKYIHILALREGLSAAEFRLRYAPVGEDAA